MKRKLFMKKSQSRAGSGFARVMTMLTLTLTMLCVQSANAFTLTCLRGNGFGGYEGCQYLFDGTQNTKWGTMDGRDGKPVYAVAKATMPIAPATYSLKIANDTKGSPGRNWKSWRIFGGNFASDADAVYDAEGWVLLDQKVDQQMTTDQFAEVQFDLSTPDGKFYSYFMIVVDAICSNPNWDAYTQMYEFWFRGFNIDLSEAQVYLDFDYKTADADANIKAEYESKLQDLKDAIKENDPDQIAPAIEAIEPIYKKINKIFSVTLKNGTADADKWTIPEEAAEGATVTATYTGKLKVKSVKAVKKVTLATVSTAPTAKTGIKVGEDKAIINAGTADGGTMYYAVTTTNAKPANSDGFSGTVPTAKTLTAGTYYVWYYVKADDAHIDSEISATAIEVTIAKVTPTFNLSTSSVSFASTDNVNATKQVTITYNGDGVLSVSSNNTKKVTASVNNKTITLTRKSVDGGTVTITVSAAAGTNYSAATDKTITVNMTAYITGKALKDASVGWKYGSDGKAYPANASLPTGVTVLGMVAYKSGSGGIVMRSTYHSEELSNWRADLAGSDPFGSTNAYTSSLSNTTSCEWRTGTQAEYKNCGLNSVSGFNTLNTSLQTAGCNKLENNRYLGAKSNKRFYSGDGEWEDWNLSGTCLIRPIFVF